jgi:PAS domain S-box-containing protein
MKHREQKAIQERPGGTAAFFKLIADTTWDWEYWQDEERNFVYVSPSCRRITGYEPEAFEADKELLSRIIHPGDRERMRKHFRQEETKQGPNTVKFRLRRKDGQQRWISHICRQVHDDEGRFLGWRSSNRDITDERRAREQLREDHRKLLELQKELDRVAKIPQDNPNPVLQVSNEGILLWMNGAARDLCREKWCLQINQPVCGEILECCREAVQKNETIHRELTCGERLFWIIFDPMNGYVNIYSRDVTERRQAEENLRNREQQLRAVLDVLPVGILITDARGRILETNPAVREIWGGRVPLPGQTKDYDVYRGYRVYTHQLIQAEQWGLSRALHHGETSGPEEIEIEGFDGRRRTILNYAMPIRNEQGRISGAVAVNVDITRRRQAVEALRESEERLRLAQEAGHVGIFDWNVETGQSVWNDEMYRIYGLDPQPREKLAADWFFRMAHPEDQEMLRQKLYRKMANEKAELWIEFRIVRPDGEVRWLSQRGFVTYGAGGELLRMIGTAVDVTEQKEAEAILRRTQEELEQRVRRRTEELAELVDNLRRETRQRAQAEEKLSQSYRELQKRADQLSRLASELTLTEQRERHRLAQILHDHLQQLLAAARMNLNSVLPRAAKAEQETLAGALNLIDEAIRESRSLSMELSPPVLHQMGLAAGLEWLARWMEDKYGLKVELQTAPGADTAREDIRTLLFQSVRELLFNTVKHAGVGRVRITMDRRQEMLQITVTDQGRGFKVQEAIEKTARAAGGFGLFTIRERMLLLGGKLEIESEPGRGAVFRLSVPVEEPASKADPPEAPRPPEESGQVIRVLLVDDHAVVRRSMASVFKREKEIVIVGEAGGGKEAIDKARELKPDVILMDVSMPDMDGLEATRIIRTELPQIRIIGLSMYDEEIRARGILDAGASAYVTKSDPPARLLAVIREVAKRR